jgi:diguanylate cyclase (GGDEF)-like protein
MKGFWWLPSVVVPTVLIVGATGGSLTAFDSANTARRDINKQQTQQHVTTPLLAITDLETLVVHGRVASWNNLNEHTDPLRDPQEIETEIGRLDASLKTSGFTKIGTADLTSHIASLSSADTKERHGGYNELIGAIEALSGKLVDGADADTTKAANRVEAINQIANAHDFALIYRTGSGVDPYPKNANLSQYLEGIFASLADKPSEERSLADWLGVTKPEPSIGDDQLRRVTELPSVAPLASELAWALSAGGSTEHPSADALRDATHTGIDAVADVVRNDIKAVKTRTDNQLVGAQRRLKLLGGLAVGCMAFGVGSFLWLLRRLHGVVTRLRLESERDHLTALLNRTGLRATTEPWFVDRGSVPIGLAVLDLDHFKAVNDTYGHTAGDELLKAIGERLSNEVIASRTAVARWGGDEFVLVYRFDVGNTVDDLASSAQRIRAALAAPVTVAGALATVGASVGGCVCSCGQCDVEDLFREADRRLYDVKRAGRGDVLVSGCGEVQPAPPQPTVGRNQLGLG